MSRHSPTSTPNLRLSIPAPEGIQFAPILVSLLSPKTFLRSDSFEIELERDLESCSGSGSDSAYEHPSTPRSPSSASYNPQVATEFTPLLTTQTPQNALCTYTYAYSYTYTSFETLNIHPPRQPGVWSTGCMCMAKLCGLAKVGGELVCEWIGGLWGELKGE